MIDISKYNPSGAPSHSSTPTDDWNYRKSLTPIQKDALRGDCETLTLVLPYLAALIRESKTEISLPTTAIYALESHLSLPSNLFELLTAFATIEHSSELFHPTLIEQMASARNSALLNHADSFGITFTIQPLPIPNNPIQIFTYRLADNQQEIGVEVPEKRNRFVLYETDGWPKNSIDSFTQTTLDYLLILDLNSILNKSPGRGKAIPRFLPFYPTRTLVKSIVTRLAPAIRLCSILSLDSINYSTFTREDFRSHLKRLQGIN